MESLINLNMKYGNKRFIYGAGYVNDSSFTSGSNFSYDYDDFLDCCTFKNNIYSNSTKRNTNVWNAFNPSLSAYLPTSIDISHLNIYFPKHSVETYNNNYLYALDISIFLNAKRVVLHSSIIDRRFALANKKTIISNNRFYESISVEIIDPWNLLYEDEWRDFRSNVLGEPLNINNIGATLTIELTPVKYSSSGYIKLDEHSAGSAVLNICDINLNALSNHLSLSLPSATQNTVKTTVSLSFNNIYSNIIDYIKETYFFSTEDFNKISINNNVLLVDKDNIYNIYSAMKAGEDIDDSETFDLLSPSEGTLEFNWDSFTEGMSLIAYTNLYNDEELVLALASNEIPVTQELYSIIVNCNDSNTPKYINLDTLNMTIQNINAVNKIDKNVVSITRPNESRSNAVTTMFIQASQGDNVKLHKNITEHISIPLQKYKGAVSLFYIRIGDIDFPEMGRMGESIIFKVVGKQLPETIEDGIYYILNENKDMVTFGNFNIN